MFCFVQDGNNDNFYITIIHYYLKITKVESVDNICSFLLELRYRIDCIIIRSNLAPIWGNIIFIVQTISTNFNGGHFENFLHFFCPYFSYSCISFYPWIIHHGLWVECVYDLARFQNISLDKNCQITEHCENLVHFTT